MSVPGAPQIAVAGAATLNAPNGIVTSEALITASSYTLTLTNCFIKATSTVLVEAYDGTSALDCDEQDLCRRLYCDRPDKPWRGTSAEFKTIGAEIAAQTSAIAKSIASLRGLAPSPPTSLLPEPATGPKPAPPPKARP
jgi:hypothetical protein